MKWITAILVLFVVSTLGFAVPEAPCACLGFAHDHSCHINLSPDRNRADQVWHCKNFCKKTNCTGDIMMH